MLRGNWKVSVASRLGVAALLAAVIYACGQEAPSRNEVDARPAVVGESEDSLRATPVVTTVAQNAEPQVVASDPNPEPPKDVARESGPQLASIRINDLPALVLVEEARIGSTLDADIGFTRIQGVDVDADGNLYVVEGAVPEIRVYSPDGLLIRRIGRRGAGPGEFQNPPRIGVLGDTVWAIESGRPLRITLFRRTGELLETGRSLGVEVRLGEDRYVLTPGALTQDGLFTSAAAVLSSGQDPRVTNAQDSPAIPMIAFTPTGEVADTIGWSSHLPQVWVRPGGPGAPPSAFVGDIPLGVSVTQRTVVSRVEQAREGYFLISTPIATSSTGASFEVTRFTGDGDTLFNRALHYQPLRYSSSDLDTIAARLAASAPNVGTPFPNSTVAPIPLPEAARAVRSAMRYHEFRSPISVVWVSADESLWLRRDLPESSTVAQWIIVDGKGEVMGEVETSLTTVIRWHSGDAVVTVERDQQGIPWLVRQRLRQP